MMYMIVGGSHGSMCDVEGCFMRLKEIVISGSGPGKVIDIFIRQLNC